MIKFRSYHYIQALLPYIQDWTKSDYVTSNREFCTSLPTYFIEVHKTSKTKPDRCFKSVLPYIGDALDGLWKQVESNFLSQEGDKYIYHILIVFKDKDPPINYCCCEYHDEEEVE